MRRRANGVAEASGAGCMRGIALLIAFAVIAFSLLSGCIGGGGDENAGGVALANQTAPLPKNISLYRAIAEVRQTKGWSACEQVGGGDAGICYTYGALTIDGAVCEKAGSALAETQCKKAVALFGGNLELCSRVTELAERDDCNAKEIFASQVYGPLSGQREAVARVRSAFNSSYSGLKFQNYKASLFEFGGGCLAQSIANGVALACGEDGCDRQSYTYALIACSRNASVERALSSAKGSVFERMALANLIANPELAERELPLGEGNKTEYREGDETVAIYQTRSSKGGAYSYEEFIFPTGAYFAYGSMLFEKGTDAGEPDPRAFMAGFGGLYSNMTGRVLANATKG